MIQSVAYTYSSTFVISFTSFLLFFSTVFLTTALRGQVNTTVNDTIFVVGHDDCGPYQNSFRILFHIVSLSVKITQCITQSATPVNEIVSSNSSRSVVCTERLLNDSFRQAKESEQTRNFLVKFKVLFSFFCVLATLQQRSLTCKLLYQIITSVYTVVTVLLFGRSILSVCLLSDYVRYVSWNKICFRKCIIQWNAQILLTNNTF